MPQLEIPITNSNDDVTASEANIGGIFTGAVVTGTGQVILGYPAQVWAGLRFLNVGIPQGATINYASLYVFVSGQQGSAIGTVRPGDLRGILADNCPAFSATGYPEHGAKTVWSTLLVAGLGDKEIMVSEQVQEIVNQAGWTSGNALGFAIDPDYSGAANVSQSWRDYSESGTKITLFVDYSGGGGPDVTAPTITSGGSFSIAENSAFYETMTANETVTWSKVGGADQGKFSLNATNGGLYLPTKNYEEPDDEGTNRTYIVVVRATDAASNYSDKEVIVTVTDVDETAPLITSGADFETPENVAFQSTATANETVTWSKAGAHASRVVLNSATGQWILKPQNYEKIQQITFTLTATDLGGNASAPQTIVVTITDVYEPPVPPSKTPIFRAIPFKGSSEAWIHPNTRDLMKLGFFDQEETPEPGGRFPRYYYMIIC